MSTGTHNDSRPLVSVVMPIYQIAPYAEDSIRSVLGQTLPNWELICVDDGSTDGSREICEGFAAVDSRVSVVCQAHAGLSTARNKGASLARGRFLYFLDGDDMITPDALLRCVEEADAFDADIVQFCARVLPQDGQQHNERQYIRSHPYEGVWDGAELYVAQREAGDYFAQACMYLSRAGVFGDGGVTFPEGNIHEDELGTYLALMKAKRVICLDKQLYVRRYRPHSIMSERDWKASVRGYFRCYAAVIPGDSADGVAAHASKLHLNAMASSCIGCFYRTGLPLSEFARTAGAQEGDEEALASLLGRPELQPRSFVARRLAWRLLSIAHMAKRRLAGFISGLRTDSGNAKGAGLS